MRRVESSFISLLLRPALLAGQGTARARVADAAGGPLARAQISADVVGTGLRTTSDDQGRYELRGVPSGSTLIHLRLLGYVPLAVRVTAPSGGAIEQDFTLSPQPIALSPVDVTVGSRARHTAAEQLALPADAFPPEVRAIQGTAQPSQRLQPVPPSVNGNIGQYEPRDYSADGNAVDVNGGWGLKLGRGSLGLFGEYMDRKPTNRAWADPFDDSGNGLTDSVNDKGQVVVKRNPVPQPNFHWGDGLERDIMTMANLRLPLNDPGTTEFYSFGGYSFRRGTGNGYRRYETDVRNWPEIYPLGFLPEFEPDVTDYSATGGILTATHGRPIDVGTSLGRNGFIYNLRHTLNTSLGPCVAPAAACAPGADGVLGNADDPGIPNQTSFMAGKMRRGGVVGAGHAAKKPAPGPAAPPHIPPGGPVPRGAVKNTGGGGGPAER